LFSHNAPLSLDLIQAELDADTRALFEDILIFDSVASTNDALWQRFEQGKTTPAICLAETQTAGRGRRGDRWQSPAAGNLYLSIYWPFPADNIRNGLSIAVGMSLINTLNAEGINDLQLKWPNDVLHQRHKLAGILVESRFSSLLNTVVGIGVNFDLPESTRTQIPQPTTSLKQLTDNPPCRSRLAGKIIQTMSNTFFVFQQRGLEDFLPHWPKYDALDQQAITLISDTEQVSATACGINDQGELRYLRDGEMHTLSNSYTSIRFNS
jgi:BirA family biotin operon repressor/biotin-[acetyl-CoA-carboxylase] ligase